MMSRQSCPLTPPKRSAPLLPCLQELSPFANVLLPSHRKISKLELLHSPTPVHHDLFSQLLATNSKLLPEPLSDCHIMEQEEQEEQEEEDCLHLRESEENDDSESSGEIDEESDENGIKKRKRKSTAQIKTLKQELEREANWSKEKIVEMSDLTGLSQSQVYKWWWDQKKKSVKGEREAFSKMMLKRKQIRKDLSRRGKGSGDYSDKENGFGFQLEDPVATKVKANVEMEQLQQTERKINKRLIFS